MQQFGAENDKHVGVQSSPAKAHENRGIVRLKIGYQKNKLHIPKS
jgi:hypothetical protein